MRFIIAAVLFFGAVAFQVRAIFIFRRMMKEVNESLPGEAQIPEFGGSWLRGKVIRLHRQFFPNSSLARKLYIAWWICMALFISSLACVIRIQPTSVSSHRTHLLRRGAGSFAGSGQGINQADNGLLIAFRQRSDPLKSFPLPAGFRVVVRAIGS
jgi:hypothetical protein